MRRQCPHSCDSRLHVTERQIAFPTHPFDPPSSPPPTSPLPPLPEIALNGDYGSPTSTISPISPIATIGHPIRPPHPQTSLPNLQPRTITSPEIFERYRYSTLLTQTRSSPTPSSRRRKDPPVDSQSLKAAGDHEAARFFRQPTQSRLQGSEDVRGALPKFFSKFSDPQSSRIDAIRHRFQAEKPVSPRISQAEFSESRTKTLKRRKKKTRKPVARSALFIPGTPPGEAPIVGKLHERDSLRIGDTCRILRNANESPSMQEAANDGSSPAFRQGCTSRKSHKRSHAVTSFALNFDQSQGSTSSTASLENLTSLPRVPSDPILFVTSVTRKKETKKRSHSTSSNARKDADEAITFAVLPYAYTLQSAGPKPMTEKDNKVRFGAECDIEAGEEQVVHLTEDETRAERRKRIVWATATVMLVIIATSGVLVGIIWKLRSLT